MDGINKDDNVNYWSSPEWVDNYTGICSDCGRNCSGVKPEGTKLSARCPICSGEIIESEERDEDRKEEEENEEEEKKKEEQENLEEEENEEQDEDTSYYTDSSSSSSDEEEDEQLDREIKLREKEEAILKTMISIVEASIKSRGEKKRPRNSARPDGESNQSKKRRLR